MPAQSLVEKSGVQIKLGTYGVASSTALADPSILPRVQDYRRQVSGRMYPLDRHDIQRKVPSANYHVSRKVDGEFTVLVYRDQQIYSINASGTVRVGLPWMDEARELLQAAKIESMMAAGEFHVAGIEGRRSRVHDIIRMARQPDTRENLQRLALGVFDILEVDAESPDDYGETWQKITTIFGSGKLVQPVETVIANSASDISRLFEQWVDQQGAEGLIARSDSAGLFKIKPRHTLDAVVIGFTESSEERQGMIHDLLLGVFRNDGAIQVLCRVGGGFSDEDRRSMLSDLKDMVVSSEYAEVNTNHVAYQMVKPQWVLEISCLDLISQTTRGAPVNRMVLHWNAKEKNYEVIRRLPLVSVISPQFIRKRDDKSAQHPQDAGIRQVADLVDVPLVDRDATGMKLPPSQLLRREVYTKLLKGELMVRKFLLWKTNKETESDEFPAYVIHYTDFSPNRKIPLSRDIRVSNSETQIEFLWAGLKEGNIKKGWELHTKSGIWPEEQAGAIGGAEPAKLKQAASDSPQKKAAKKKKVVKTQASASATSKKKSAGKKKPAKKAVKKNAVKKKAVKKKPAKQAARKNPGKK